MEIIIILNLNLTFLYSNDLYKLYLPENNNNIEVINLLKYCLCCNGYGRSINLSSLSWDTALQAAVKKFREDVNLTSEAKVDTNTWMALLLSKGNPDRTCTACDTNQRLDQDKINYLKTNGYYLVGRYLANSAKGITRDEAELILDNNMKFFPIFQSSGLDESISSFTLNRADQHAISALAYAKNLGLPQRTIIYFAVDYDATDYDISEYVLPYFKSLYNKVKNEYKVGIYGTRNACTKVMGAGYAETCFVSDMSTGYSGNMGFKIPNNWNLDQFHEYSVTTASGSWDIDKVSYSNRFPVVSFIDMQTRVIPANVTNYHFGDVQFFKENTGEWFRVNAKKMKYRVVWESLDGTSIMPHLDVNLEKKGIGTVWREERHYNIYEYESDLMDTSTESIYRFKYFCADAGLYGEMDPRYLNAKVSIYIDTFA